MYCPSKQLAVELAYKYGTPLFVTSAETIRERVRLLKTNFGPGVEIFYALKANYNPEIVKVLKDAEIDGIDAASPLEIEWSMKLGFKNCQIIFTGNNSSTSEMSQIYKDYGVLLNIGSLSELERFAMCHRNASLSLRLNPKVGEGEFKGMITGGQDSKFGLLPKDLDRAEEILAQYNIKLVGLHCHIGSGLYTVNKFSQAISFMTKMTQKFRPSEFVDFGGGFGVRYNEDTPLIDLKAFGREIQEFLSQTRSRLGYRVKAIIEPGKFLVAESTCLLTTVTNVKVNSSDVIFIGTDTGMNHVIRPALYSASHSIINITNNNSTIKDQEKSTIDSTKVHQRVHVVGNICESTDVLGRGVLMTTPPIEGDILGILTTGGYCSSMSSLYNMRPYAIEVMVERDEQYRVIRERVNLSTMISGLGFVM